MGRSSAPSVATIAVRELCAFAAKQGDLDMRFTPSPTSQQGIEGHAAVAGRRGRGYRREITLRHQAADLHVVGRADGMRPRPLVLEEIKTFRGDLARMPDNHRHLHWAQLKTYGAMLCEERKLQSLKLNLVYYDVDKGRETILRDECSAEALDGFFCRQLDVYRAWNAAQLVHRARRDASLSAMRFAHADFHSGQRKLAEATYRAIKHGRKLLAQAPTGTGKSVGTLFPALKAMAQGHIDKIFYLTAKTSGRKAALDAVESLVRANGAIPLRVLELTSRDKLCVHPDRLCTGSSCPRASGFYDRLPGAREAASTAENGFSLASIKDIAERHGICPYYFAQELTRWADVVVGDYNYYFDRSALFYDLAKANHWRVSVLVDEAHNLVERSRRMYSSTLIERDIPQVGKAQRRVRQALRRLDTDWQGYASRLPPGYTEQASPPEVLIDDLTSAVAAIGELAAESPDEVPKPLQRFQFDASAFLELADKFGVHSVCDIVRRGDPHSAQANSELSIRNVVPAPFLASRFEAASSVVLFSATIAAPDYHLELLGLGGDAAWIDVESPFRAEQVQVRIAGQLSTRYKDRDASIAPITQLISNEYRQQPGNYIAFFSSYDYLEKVHTALSAGSTIPLLKQSPGMSEPEQQRLLDQLTDDSALLCLAVLGGAFAEGVDLPGRRLIGVFVATLGLPQVNAINDAARSRIEQVLGKAVGYDYTYLYPGIQKVVQAAGRLIRTPQDRGAIHLIDDRFKQARINRLLPKWWQVGVR
jgi:DNA excision repair protein ERCC-2